MHFSMAARFQGLAPLKSATFPGIPTSLFMGSLAFSGVGVVRRGFRAEKLLVEARDALEIRVERTAEFTTANQELQRAQDELSQLTPKLAQENLYLGDEIRSDANFKDIVGKSRELRRVLKLVETVAPTDSKALTYG